MDGERESRSNKKDFLGLLLLLLLLEASVFSVATELMEADEDIGRDSST